MHRFLIILLCVVLAPLSYGAALVNPGQTPIEITNSVNVKPNIMFMLDNSGSMLQDYVGDEVMLNPNCKTTLGLFSRECVSSDWWLGTNTVMPGQEVMDPANGIAPDTPFFAYDFNHLYYNPNITYMPGVNSSGVSYGNQTITNAYKNIYQSTATINLLTSQRETYFCTLPIVTTSQLLNTLTCRRNGIDTNSTFDYHTEAYPALLFSFPVPGATTPFYYDIIPQEYCDYNLVNCATTQSAAYQYPAKVRWCKNPSDASLIGLITGLLTLGQTQVPVCQKSYDTKDGYIYPRFGKFRRVAVPSSQYTNYANWFTFYRTRSLTMKTAAGLAFSGMDSSKRAGFITTNPGSPVVSSQFVAIADFTTTQRKKFLDTLYAITPSGATPLREALSRVGRYYAGKSDGINTGMINSANLDPVQYSCQQNFTFLATDGYWNGNAGQTLTGGTIGNQDNVNAGYSTRTYGAYDGGLSGSSNTLADVAMYYYQTDLRPTGSLGANSVDVSENNVPVNSSDTNPAQHMVTYGLGFGISGFVGYTPDYYKGTSQDLQNIKAGTIGQCTWTTGTCDWPSPSSDDLSAVDDLWHAVINGRGRYYSAYTVNDILKGIQDALNGFYAQTASGAATMITNPQISTTNNLTYYTSYRTYKWDGNVLANTIDPITGNINTANPTWSAQSLLQSQVSNSSDTRNIYFISNTSTNSALKTFASGNMNATEIANFTNKCTLLSQCSSLTTTQTTLVNTADNLINFLRGQRQYEQSTNLLNPLFRDRDYAMGDIVSSNIASIGNTANNWSDAGYANFVTSIGNRAQTLFVGANDGMLHAFDATSGQEKWAVIPAQVFPNLYKLADVNYPTNHQFYLNGTITTMDVNTSSGWKTILVGGLGAGGKGYYALDVTNPNTPKALWEICNTTACSVTDNDMGYSYGNPIITKRAFDGKWVVYVSSGYDSATGKGIVYELDAASGAILRKLATNTGTATSPAGVSKINTLYNSYSTDNTATALYAGDLDGNVWKWDLSTNTTTPTLLATLKNPSTNPQPITTKIELARIQGQNVLFVATGRYLNNADFTNTQIQSVYAMKDTNSWGNIRNNTTFIQQTLTPGTISSTASTNNINWSVNSGWYFDLTSESGERVNIDPVLTLGTLNVISNVPGNANCSVGGDSWSYQIDYQTGSAVTGNNNIIAKKLPAGLIVGHSVIKLMGPNILKDILMDSSGKMTPLSINYYSASSLPKKTLWREIINDR